MKPRMDDKKSKDFDRNCNTDTGNEIYDNKMDGMSVKSGGNPSVTGNVIRDGKGKGIFVHDKGRGSFVSNDIAGLLAPPCPALAYTIAY